MSVLAPRMPQERVHLGLRAKPRDAVARKLARVALPSRSFVAECERDQGVPAGEDTAERLAVPVPQLLAEQDPRGGWTDSTCMDPEDVLGTRRGSLPEIVSPEVGALGDTLDELVELRARLDAVEPDACRAHVERHFTHHVMAEGYLRMFRAYLADGVLPEGKLLETS